MLQAPLEKTRRAARRRNWSMRARVESKGDRKVNVQTLNSFPSTNNRQCNIELPKSKKVSSSDNSTSLSTRSLAFVVVALFPFSASREQSKPTTSIFNHSLRYIQKLLFQLVTCRIILMHCNPHQVQWSTLSRSGLQRRSLLCSDIKKHLSKGLFMASTKAVDAKYRTFYGEGEWMTQWLDWLLCLDDGLPAFSSSVMCSSWS